MNKLEETKSKINWNVWKDLTPLSKPERKKIEWDMDQTRKEQNWNEWCNLPLAEKNKILDDIFDEMEKEFWPNEDGGES